MAGRRYITTKPKRTLPNDISRSQRAREIGSRLVSIGLEHGDRFPWHHTSDPFRILVAEYLLSRTARLTVERVYNNLFFKYPDAEALAQANSVELAEITKEAGLPTKTAGLRELARRVSEEGEVKQDREWLVSLPFVGDYIADAVMLYAFKQPVVPLDRNFQRVIHRAFFDTEPPKRSIEPYRDSETVYVVDEITMGLNVEDIRRFHQGLLVVAWDFCRYRPRTTACSIKEYCLFSERFK